MLAVHDGSNLNFWLHVTPDINDVCFKGGHQPDYMDLFYDKMECQTALASTIFYGSRSLSQSAAAGSPEHFMNRYACPAGCQVYLYVASRWVEQSVCLLMSPFSSCQRD